MVKVFVVKGTFKMGDDMQPFIKECKALDEKAAKEFVYSELGSKHRTPRGKIRISEVKETKAEKS